MSSQVISSQLQPDFRGWLDTRLSIAKDHFTIKYMSVRNDCHYRHKINNSVDAFVTDYVSLYIYIIKCILNINKTT